MFARLIVASFFLFASLIFTSCSAIQKIPQEKQQTLCGGRRKVETAGGKKL